MVAKAMSRGFLLIVMVVTASSGGTIAFDSIAGGFNQGIPPASIFNVIGSQEELNIFCTAVNYDTTQLVTKPDFAEKTIIALLTMEGVGERVIHRHIQQIIDDEDTAFMEIRSDTGYIDADIKPVPAYGFTLFSIPKTDKPIKLREVPTSIIKPSIRKTETRFSGRQIQGIYDGQGRLLNQRSGKYPGIVVFSRDFPGGKNLLLGNQP